VKGFQLGLQLKSKSRQYVLWLFAGRVAPAVRKGGGCKKANSNQQAASRAPSMVHTQSPSLLPAAAAHPASTHCRFLHHKGP
jgi:hypothetical protein